MKTFQQFAADMKPHSRLPNFNVDEAWDMYVRTCSELGIADAPAQQSAAAPHQPHVQDPTLTLSAADRKAARAGGVSIEEFQAVRELEVQAHREQQEASARRQPVDLAAVPRRLREQVVFLSADEKRQFAQLTRADAEALAQFASDADEIRSFLRIREQERELAGR
jgi:hypothetical protein